MHCFEEIERFVPQCAQEEGDRRLMLDFIAQYPHNVLTRENPVAHMTASGLILNRDVTRAVLIHHNIYNSWTWTGGHADGETDMLALALREAQEETGLVTSPLKPQALSLDIIPVRGHVKRGGYISPHIHFSLAYALLADEDAPLQVKPDENSGVKWVDLADLPEIIIEPYMMPIYNKVIEGARK